MSATRIKPVQCYPWCVDGEGHPDDMCVEDQTCYTIHHEVNLSLYPSIQCADRRFVPDYVHVHAIGYHDSPAVPQIEVGKGDDAGFRLTAAEARELAATLTAVAEEIDPDR